MEQTFNCDDCAREYICKYANAKFDCVDPKVINGEMPEVLHFELTCEAYEPIDRFPNVLRHLFHKDEEEEEE